MDTVWLACSLFIPPPLSPFTPLPTPARSPSPRLEARSGACCHHASPGPSTHLLHIIHTFFPSPKQTTPARSPSPRSAAWSDASSTPCAPCLSVGSGTSPWSTRPCTASGYIPGARIRHQGIFQVCAGSCPCTPSMHCNRRRTPRHLLLTVCPRLPRKVLNAPASSTLTHTSQQRHPVHALRPARHPHRVGYHQRGAGRGGTLAAANQGPLGCGVHTSVSVACGWRCMVVSSMSLFMCLSRLTRVRQEEWFLDWFS